MLRYAITDRTRIAGSEHERQAALLRQASHWATDGIDFLQVREKDLEPAALAALARHIGATLRAHRPAPKLLINARLDVAIAVAADGVHLPSASGSLTPAQVRTIFASANLPEPIVSVSCHTLADVARARDSHATFILFGPVYEKVAFENRMGDILVGAGTGLDLLRAACTTAAPVPVLALGGITCARIPACLAAGAAGIAAIRLFARIGRQ